MKRLFTRVLGKIRQTSARVASSLAASVHRKPYLWAGVALFLVAVVVFQLTYTADKALPWAKLDGKPVGGQSAEQIRDTLKKDYATVSLQLTIKTKKFTSTASEAGLDVDDSAVVEGLSSYPLWQRLLPFSLPVVGLTKNQAVTTKINQSKFAEYATGRGKDCAVAPKNAAVMVKGEKATLDPAKDGQACPKDLLENVFKSVALTAKGVKVSVEPKVVKPERSDKDVESVLKEAQAVIDQHLDLAMADKKVTVSKADIASWLNFPQNEKDASITVSLDQTKVQQYLAKAQSAIYIAPGTTQVYTLDSVETSRTVGANGRGVDAVKTASAISAQVLQHKGGTVTATLATLAPKLVYVRSYSATQAGLQALLADIAKDKGDYAISVRTMSGVTASANGTKRYHPASTYKMYVGWAIIQRVAAGQMKWEDAATGGKNVSQCFDVMIINSDNACGEWLGEQIGWTNLNNKLRAIGFSCTNLASAWYSCASDETLFLYKLQAGQLLPADQADRLLSVMKRQVYRAGIPAGVGVTVADKVGFLNGMLHDSGIVYASHGTYTVSIMTSGSSWVQIADAARQIQAQLNRM